MQHEKKIRILECIRQGQIGGGESHLLSLLENLNKSVYEPIVLSFTDGPMIERLKIMNVRTYVISSEKPFDFRIRKKITNLILNEKIELVHCHGTRAFSNLYLPVTSMNIPTIYTIHGWSFHDNQHPIIKKIRIWFEQFLTSKSSANIAVSESNKITGEKKIRNFKATVINNGIDQQKFDPTKKFKDIRSELNILPSAVIVIFIARFTSQKQPLSLINSFANALKENPSLEMVMVGEGDETEMALEMVSKLKLSNKIHFLPFRQDVPDLLAAADIFVLPSLWEGLPIGLLEAMSMGKAIIATNVDGTREIIINNENGLLIDTDLLSEKLTKAILYLSVNENIRNQLADNAKRTIQNKFSASEMTIKTESVYDEVLMRKKISSNNKILNHGV
jgi:glycosyltransferase involved in cell wall biosynthesis